MNKLRWQWLQEALVETTECLLWPFPCSGRYPRVGYEGKSYSAHQLAWLLTHGDLPVYPLELRHICGHTHCFNPVHLLPGTHSENEADKKVHGTVPCGEAHHSAKLTLEQVLEIRASVDGYKKLARKYEVDRTTIRRIKRNQLWRHV